MLLNAEDRKRAVELIRTHHYTHSVPSGKSHYVRFEDAIVVWSIPANKNIARFILGWQGNVWELSRLWAPDGHDRNLLTQAISAAVKIIQQLENPDALVSYADPNAGHKGGVYRAASWIYHGKSEETRAYKAPNGQVVARRSFHSGKKGLCRAEIEALGFTELKLPGKERFVRPLSKQAVRKLKDFTKARGGQGSQNLRKCVLRRFKRFPRFSRPCPDQGLAVDLGGCAVCSDFPKSSHDFDKSAAILLKRGIIGCAVEIDLTTAGGGGGSTGQATAKGTGCGLSHAQPGKSRIAASISTNDIRRILFLLV